MPKTEKDKAQEDEGISKLKAYMKGVVFVENRALNRRNYIAWRKDS